MAATEAFVKEQIKEVEDKWDEKLNDKFMKMKEEIKAEVEEMRTSVTGHKGGWKEASQIEKYKERFRLRMKEANAEKSTIKLCDDNFMEFKQQVTGWMKALHPVIKKVMETLERPENRTVEEENIKEQLVEEMRKQAGHTIT